MQFVKVTVNGRTYHLVKQLDGTWVVTNQAPRSAGEYLMTVTLVTENGQEIEIDTEDEELRKAITLLVTEGDTESGNRMLDYYPQAIKQILEFQALTNAEGYEVDFLKSDIQLVGADAWFTTMGELRTTEWEKALKITPSNEDTLDDRRERIIATLRGRGKLNTALINSVVGAFTNGGTAESYIENGVLYIKINAPNDNKQFKFTNVEDTLKNLVPAHLGLSVTRNYATWGEIMANYANWDSIKQLNSWEELMLYVAPQQGG